MRCNEHIVRAIFNRYRSSHNQQVTDWLLGQLTKSGKMQEYSEFHISNDYEVYVGLVICLTSLQEQCIATMNLGAVSLLIHIRVEKKRLQQTRRTVQNGVLKRRLLNFFLHILWVTCTYTMYSIYQLYLKRQTVLKHEQERKKWAEIDSSYMTDESDYEKDLKKVKVTHKPVWRSNCKYMLGLSAFSTPLHLILKC